MLVAYQAAHLHYYSTMGGEGSAAWRDEESSWLMIPCQMWNWLST